MMTEEIVENSKLEKMFAQIYKEVAAQEDSLQKIRSKAWDHFQEIGFPSKEMEVYKYIPLHKIRVQTFACPTNPHVSKETVQEYVYPECQESFIVFINGYYSEELSCCTAIADKIVISELSQSTRTYGAFLNNHWAKRLKEELDPFAIINAAIHKNGVFIYIPPNLAIEIPLQIIHIVDQLEEQSLIAPRIQIFIGKSSEIKVYSSWNVLDEKNYFANQVIDFSLEDNAKACLTQTVLGHGSKNYFFDAVRASLKRNSQFESININDGLETYRNDYHITLTQEGANAELECIAMVKDRDQSHSNILMDHQAPHCTSRQLFKYVLKDESKSSFEGKILVRQIAQKTDAFQLNNNILLSEKAEAKSKPNLEIYPDDVKASHGATFGKLNQEEIFYLKSRGYSSKDAHNLLIYAFCKEVIDRIKLPSLFNSLKKLVENFNH